MKTLSSSKREIGLAATLVLGVAPLFLASEDVPGAGMDQGGLHQNFVRTVAEKTTPNIGSNNMFAGGARVIIPDGTNMYQSYSGSETRWFTFEAEPGKTYNVEVLNPYDDLGFNAIGLVSITDDLGLAAPPETSFSCFQSNRPPGLEVSGDGVRCIIRTFYPTNGLTQNKRGIYIGIGPGVGTQLQLRVREATIYGRWTTNGYDFHVEVQNTTSDSVCAEIDLYPNSGFAYTAGAWVVGGVGFPYSTSLTVPPLGANKVVIPAGTLSVNDNRGTLRIHDCGSGELVSGGVHLSTYAYNPVTDKFLYFFPTMPNNGGASHF